MQDESAQSGGANMVECGKPPLEFSERVAHLKAGYDNGQSVARFLDTKASAVIGAVPVVIGALTALLGVVKDWGRWETALASQYSCLLWMSLVATTVTAAILLLTAVSAIVSAFKVITPRNTGDAKPSVLFPFEHDYGSSVPDNSFVSRVAFIKNDGNQSDVLEDYERQLIRMSQIVAQKLRCVSDAVAQLRQFFVAAVWLLGLVSASTLISALLARGAGVVGPSAPTSPASSTVASSQPSSQPPG